MTEQDTGQQPFAPQQGQYIPPGQIPAQGGPYPQNMPFPQNAQFPQNPQHAPYPQNGQYVQYGAPPQAPWGPPQQAPWGPPPQGAWGPVPPQGYGPPPGMVPPQPPKKSKKGWVIGGIAGLIIVIGIATAASGGVSKNSSSPAKPKAAASSNKSPLDHSEDVTITSCAKDSTTGFPTAKVKVTNNSSKPSDYSITVAFTSPDGATQYDTGLAGVSNLNPGQSTTQEASSLQSDVPSGFVCKVADTTRFSAVG